MEQKKKIQNTSLVYFLIFSEMEYTVKVFTGDVSYAGTDANVFITLYGEHGDTGERHLKESATHVNKFERNQVRCGTKAVLFISGSFCSFI